MKNLRPAIMNNGKLHIGEEGSHHDDLNLTGQRGFVDGKGAFLPRSKATAWVKENQPLVYKKLSDRGALHTTEYNAATKKEKKVDTEPGETEKETQVADLSKLKCVVI